MSKYSILLAIAAILSTAQLLGILDNTVIQWSVALGIYLAGVVLCFLVLSQTKPEGAFFHSLSISALLCCLFFWLNYRFASAERREFRLAVESKGCNGCERIEPSVHHPVVVVQYEGKTFELAFSHTQKAAVEAADSCRVFVAKGLFGFEFIPNWRL